MLKYGLSVKIAYFVSGTIYLRYHIDYCFFCNLEIKIIILNPFSFLHPFVFQ